jgi:hypothetical protein
LCGSRALAAFIISLAQDPSNSMLKIADKKIQGIYLLEIEARKVVISPE